MHFEFFKDCNLKSNRNREFSYELARILCTQKRNDCPDSDQLSKLGLSNKLKLAAVMYAK